MLDDVDVVLVFFIVNFGHVSHDFFSVSIVEFEQVNVDVDVINIVLIFFILTLSMFNMFF